MVITATQDIKVMQGVPVGRVLLPKILRGKADGAKAALLKVLRITKVLQVKLGLSGLRRAARLAVAWDGVVRPDQQATRMPVLCGQGPTR